MKSDLKENMIASNNAFSYKQIYNRITYFLHANFI